MLQMESQGQLLEKSLFLGGGQSFCSFQAFNLLDTAHQHYGGQSFHSKSTNLNVNLSPKHLHGIMFDQKPGRPVVQPS